MLVYGDRSKTIRPSAVLREIVDGLERAPDVQALIWAGQLAQALADTEFEAFGFDDLTELQDAAMALVVAAARRLYAGGSLAEVAAARDWLAAQPLPAQLTCRVPEGYAFYAVYPEAYALAATELAWERPPLVIGLRSIGTSLAGVVAAATGGSAMSLRPHGHPFDRRITASERLRARVRAHAGPFAIVDEGPGLSGSSFAAAAAFLEEQGASADKVVWMPSHAGDPGGAGEARHRTRWSSARRQVRTLDDLLERKSLEMRFGDLTGRVQKVEDISGGAWRRAWPGKGPPATPILERRKFRIRADRGEFVARFAGIGEEAEAKWERFNALHAAGFAVEPMALRDGLLLERWCEGRPFDIQRDRERLLRWLAGYLAFRARAFPAPDDAGAAAPALKEMALYNASQLGQAEAAERLEQMLSEEALAGLRDRPVYVDGRLHAWEWRLVSTGFCKLDAVDHAAAHDLVGAQDIAWDVAGAQVEFGLSPEEAAWLAAAAGANEKAARLLAPCYAAFQGGLFKLVGDGPPAQARSAFYAAQLGHLTA